MAVRVQRQEIPVGDAGTRITVRRMVDLIRQGAWQPVVRQAALRILGGVDGRQGYQQALELRQWLVDHFRFVRDPTDNELLHSPVHLLTTADADTIIRGDCDDSAILGASLASAVGLQARLVVVAFLARTAPMRHVWAEVSAPSGPDKGRWVELDVTRVAQNLPWQYISRTWIVPVVAPLTTSNLLLGALVLWSVFWAFSHKTKT